MSHTFSLLAFQQGDKKAFNHVFKLLYKNVCYFAEGIVGDNSEDIVQESFVKLWERRSTFDSIDSIKAFLYLSTKNACFNVHKHKKVINRFQENFVAATTDAEERNVIHKLVEAEVLYEVQEALRQLPKSYQQVIYLRYFLEMSNQEVADELKISVNTVKTMRARGFSLLKNLLKKDSSLLFINSPVLLTALLSHF
ncbi:MAG TPA: RNA polymerase sigma-70 factor [Pedobacter sp.]|jgi:RNA polymerase sigma-70 factor (ECF subfamily)